jgi:glutamyl-tRNA synthetase
MERVTSCVDTFKAEVTNKKRAKSKETNYEIGLMDTEKGVVTRFPPEPS